MFDFLNAIKSAVSVFVAGIVALGSILLGNSVQAPPAPAPIAPQIQITEPSSTAAISSSTLADGEERKTAKPEEKKTANTKNPTISGQITSTAPIASQKLLTPQNIQPGALQTTTVPSSVQAPVSLSPPSPSSLPPQIQIDPQTIVGILCYFNVPGDSSERTVLVRGSGVLINSKGYILTNRHILSPSGYVLDHCNVGQLPQGTRLPTASEIRAINPAVRITVLGYTAEPVYDSSSLPLGAVESEYADFAILKITGLSEDGPGFGVTSLPSSFPYAKLLPVNNYDIDGEEILTYGFPGDVSAGQNDSFQTLTMTGSVGNVIKVEVGDEYYADIPLVVYTNLEISRGRSGSPLFWRGYAIGLTTFYVSGNRTDSGSVASDAIIKGLSATDYIER